MEKKNTLVNVGIPRDLHREMVNYTGNRGMKLRSFQAILWTGFQLLSPEQVILAQTKAGRYLGSNSEARRPRRQKQTSAA